MNSKGKQEMLSRKFRRPARRGRTYGTVHSPPGSATLLNGMAQTYSQPNPCLQQLTSLLVTCKIHMTKFETLSVEKQGMDTI